MADLNQYKFSKEHEWIKQEGDLFVLGITHYAQDSLGDVVFIELPEIHTSFEKDDFLGNIESVKAVSEMYIPITGEVIEVNTTLENEPELINQDPYHAGWIIKIKPANAEELQSLMDEAAYNQFVETS